MSDEYYNVPVYYGSGDPSPTHDSIPESHYSPCSGWLNEEDISGSLDPSSYRESGTGDDASMALEDEDASCGDLFQAESGSGGAENFEQPAPLLDVAMPGVDDTSLAEGLDLVPANENPSPYPTYLPDYDLMEGTMHPTQPPNAEPPPRFSSYQGGPTNNPNRVNLPMQEHPPEHLQAYPAVALHVDQGGGRREQEWAYQRSQPSAARGRGYDREQYEAQSGLAFEMALGSGSVAPPVSVQSRQYRDSSTWGLHGSWQHPANRKRVAARESVRSSHDEPWSQMNTRGQQGHANVEQPPLGYFARTPSKDWSNTSSEQTPFTAGSSWRSDPTDPMAFSIATLRAEPTSRDYGGQDDYERMWPIVVEPTGIDCNIAPDSARDSNMDLDPTEPTTNTQSSPDRGSMGLQSSSRPNNWGTLRIPVQGHSSEGSSPSPSIPSVTSSSYPDPVVCDECGKEYSGDYRKGNLARHRRQKHAGAEKTYVCEAPNCGSGPFKRQDARLKHYRRRHPWLAAAAPIPRKY